MLARSKGGMDASRIQTDAAFQRTRENGEELGRAGTTGKTLRLAFRTFLQSASDCKMVSRLTMAMLEVIKADATSTRGQRNFLDGELEMLEGFDFNIDGKLVSTLFIAYTAAIDGTTGALTVAIPSFLPLNAIASLTGATHMRFISTGASIDFEAGTIEAVTSQSADILLAETPAAAVNLDFKTSYKINTMLVRHL
jgi:hypothetical protein